MIWWEESRNEMIWKSRPSLDHRGFDYGDRTVPMTYGCRPIFKGIPNFRQMRIQMLRAETVTQLNDLLEQCRELLR